VPIAALLVRSLGRENFGALAFSLTIVGIAGKLADLGLTAGGIARALAAAKTAAEGARLARTALLVGVLGGTVATVGCAAGSLLLHGPTRSVLLILSPMALLVVIRGVLVAHLRVVGYVRLAEGSTALMQALYYVGAATLVGTGEVTVDRIAGLLVLTPLATVVVVVPTWARLTAVKVQGVRAAHVAKPLIRFSLPLVVGSLSWFAMQQSDVMLLGVFRGTKEVGFYSPVLQTVDIVATIVFVLTAYYVPMATRTLRSGGVAELGHLYVIVAKWGVVLSAPLLAALAVAPGPLLGLLYGAGWRTGEAAALARVLAIGYAVFIATGQNGNTLLALGNSKALAVRSVLALVGNILVNVLLIPPFGALGAAAGTAVAYCGLNAGNSALLWRTARIQPVRRDYVTVVVTALALAAASFAFVHAVNVADSIGAPLGSAIIVGVGTLVAWYRTSAPDELFRPAAFWASMR
jgi:O-antigen/teichoic acid export membrane protein